MYRPDILPPYDARGSEYALYLLEVDEEQARERARAHGYTDWREGWGLRGRLWDKNQVKRPRSGAVPAKAFINDAAGTVVVPGLEYLNYPAEKMAGIDYDMSFLSYNRAAWRVSERLPYFTTWNGRGLNNSWMGRYTPWVRPEHMIGLPTDELRTISDYGAKWGVCLGNQPIGTRGSDHD